jgi:hypothetical protein
VEDNPTLCNYRWKASMLVHDTDKKVTMVEQKCTLIKNHKGDHISWARVTAANERTYPT